MRVVDALAVVCLLAALLVATIALRRRRLGAADGALECALRRRDRGDGGGWAPGVLRYRDGELAWWRVFSLSARPEVVLARADGLAVVSRRTADPAEHLAVAAGGSVLLLRVAGREVELALSETGTTGLLAWLEAGPPGATTALAS